MAATSLLHERSPTILVIGDISGQMAFATDFLARSGFIVLTLRDGAAAVQHIQTMRPDLTLLDATVSGPDSVDVCRRIKANPRVGPTPVIFITQRLSGHAIAALVAGGDDYMTMPLQPEELLIRVNACMQMYALRRQQAEYAGLDAEQTGSEFALYLPPSATNIPGSFHTFQMSSHEHICRIVCASRYEAIQKENAKLASRLRKFTAISPGILGEYLMSPDGHVTMPSASPRLEEITGWKCEDVVKDAGLALRSIHPDDLERHVASIEDSARTLQAWRDEFRVFHPAKGEIWIEGRAIPERELDGTIRWYGFLHDVTERKRAEGQLHASEQQLRALAKRREDDIEEERRRIARELHDELGQQLVALRMNITLLDIRFGDEGGQMSEATGRMLALVDTIIQSTRDVSASLRPTMLDMGLIPALEWLTANFTRHAEMHCNIQVPQGEVKMTDEQAVVIFRIAQESMTNAARHSKATRVDVVFRCEPEAFVIEIKDNGIGFDVQNIRKPNTFGLVGMRERALRAGGEMVVVSERGRGALVQVRIPVTATTTSPIDLI